MSVPVAVRTVVDHAALERALEGAGSAVSAGDSARLVVIAEKKLAGRAVEALSAAERQQLVDALRQELVKLSPGAAERRRRLLADAKAMFSAENGSTLIVSTASAPGGTWVFFHDGSKTSPVIGGESFFPDLPGTPVPAKRPDPKKAGIAGSPSWRTASGGLVTKPPPLPAKPVTVPSGLDAQALEKAPDIVLGEIARARTAAVEAAERQAAPVKLSAAPGSRRAGQRIARITKVYPEVPGGVWDECTVAEGVTGPEVDRMPDSEMDKVLPTIGSLTDDPKLQGMARMHAFGPILGDETLAGVAYGPHVAANLLASGHTEGFARVGAKQTGRLNVKAGTPVKVSQYVKYRPVKGSKAGRYPFVVAVKYEYTLESGARTVAVIDISPRGEVTYYIDR
ncbi:hypothetical protein CF165_07330 [Amycolatopsis vastitatis]|uniref:Uncharacterized protein n=1 Tax=Amycolatopsis vastitatis TaxID=1905142 RepID=A0A229TDK9_9PSEU|nr:hypothetical protein CF165_07330 [Amycolatopsis vastitatis]